MIGRERQQRILEENVLAAGQARARLDALAG